MKKIIIVTGIPGVGKTTLAKNVAEKLRMLLIYKDEIKEILFDTVGVKDREWSKTLGVASYALMYSMMDKIMKTGHSLVVESNFSGEEDSAKLKRISSKYGYDILTIYCYADLEKTFRRFKKRHESGRRHPGHTDHKYIKTYIENLGNKDFRLDIGKKCIDVDMNDFKKVDINKIIGQFKDERKVSKKIIK